MARLDSKYIKRYNGETHFPTFEAWVMDVCIYMRAQGYGGPDRDAERITIVPGVLGPEAIDWMRMFVLSPNRDKVHWTFIEVIHAFYDRFIHASTTQDSRNAFENAKFEREKGVDAYHAKLVEHAWNMATGPDQFTMNMKFLSGLPDDYLDKILEDHLTAENASLSELLTAARRAENIEREKRLLKRTIQKSSSHQTHKSSSRPPDKKKDAHDSRPKIQTITGKRRDIAKLFQGSKRMFIIPKKDSGHHNPRPSNHNDRNRDAHRGDRHDSNNVKSNNNDNACFKCGKKGHYAPDCPQNKGRDRVHVRAAHTAVPEDEDTRSHHSERQDDDNYQSDHHQKESDNDTITVGFSGHSDAPDDDNEGTYSDNESYRAMRAIEDDEPPPLQPVSDSEESYTDSEGGENSPRNKFEIEFRKNYAPNEPILRNSTLESTERCGASNIVDSQSAGAKTQPKESTRYKLRIKRNDVRERPQRTIDEKRCLLTYTELGGRKALTLWDSGSTTSGVTPNFAYANNMSCFLLKNPVRLQLGTVGSKSMITYGTLQTIYGPQPEYLDIINLDRYDAVLGVDYMNRHRVKLDFDKCEIQVDGRTLPATIAVSESATPANRTRVHKPKPN
jgi:hypothetical protein